MAKTFESTFLKPEPGRINACARLAVEKLAGFDGSESLADRGFSAESDEDVLMFLSSREVAGALVLDRMLDERFSLGTDEVIVRAAIRDWERIHIRPQLVGAANG
jgi:hypothetical protein